MIVYLDSNFICHSENKAGYIEANHSFFDSICREAIDCYKYIPKDNFIQCIDSNRASFIQLQHDREELQRQLEQFKQEVNNG